MSGWANDGRGIPPRLRRLLATALGPAAMLHLYIGWRLLPDLGLSGMGWTAGVVFLCLSTLLIPVGMAARFLIRSPDLADSINWIGVWACGC